MCVDWSAPILPAAVCRDLSSSLNCTSKPNRCLRSNPTIHPELPIIASPLGVDHHRTRRTESPRSGPGDGISNHAPPGREEQKEPKGVGDESGRQEHRAGDQDQQSIEETGSGNPPLLDLLLDLSKHPSPSSRVRNAPSAPVKTTRATVGQIPITSPTVTRR